MDKQEDVLANLQKMFLEFSKNYRDIVEKYSKGEEIYANMIFTSEFSQWLAHHFILYAADGPMEEREKLYQEMKKKGAAIVELMMGDKTAKADKSTN